MQCHDCTWLLLWLHLADLLHRTPLHNYISIINFFRSPTLKNMVVENNKSVNLQETSAVAVMQCLCIFRGDN